ncbi:hypothetical protein FRC03_012891 [Tulasnella sp. 419]|nr:hypothetical protein FRC03_012891 [Tulasnella sp. 419]
MQSVTTTSESSSALPLTPSLNASLGPVAQVSGERQADYQVSLYEHTSAASEDSMAAFFDVDEVGPRCTTFVDGVFLSDYLAGTAAVVPGDDHEDLILSGATFGSGLLPARLSTPSLQDAPFYECRIRALRQYSFTIPILDSGDIDEDDRSKLVLSENPQRWFIVIDTTAFSHQGSL